MAVVTKNVITQILQSLYNFISTLEIVVDLKDRLIWKLRIFPEMN